MEVRHKRSIHYSTIQRELRLREKRIALEKE